MNEPLIISNNPLVAAHYKADFVNGSPLEVMQRARNLVQSGWRLWSHPIAGNIRLLRNPYRSVIVCQPDSALEVNSVLQVEEAYWRLSQVSFDATSESDSDYRVMDFELVRVALEKAVV